MAKATWRGHEIYMIGDFRNGWAKILFTMDWYHSPLTGTGAAWVPLSEIVVEAA